jgi:hypothetical protein
VALFVPALFLVILGLLPSRALARRAAIGGAVLMLVFFGLSVALAFAPDSDTSIQLSNWNAHQNARGFFVTIWVVELAAAALFAVFAVRRARALPIRIACFSCGLCVLLITFALGVALSN